MCTLCLGPPAHFPAKQYLAKPHVGFPAQKYAASERHKFSGCNRLRKIAANLPTDSPEEALFCVLGNVDGLRPRAPIVLRRTDVHATGRR